MLSLSHLPCRLTPLKSIVFKDFFNNVFISAETFSFPRYRSTCLGLCACVPSLARRISHHNVMDYHRFIITQRNNRAATDPDKVYRKGFIFEVIVVIVDVAVITTDISAVIIRTILYFSQYSINLSYYSKWWQSCRFSGVISIGYIYCFKDRFYDLINEEMVISQLSLIKMMMMIIIVIIII